MKKGRVTLVTVTSPSRVLDHGPSYPGRAGAPAGPARPGRLARLLRGPAADPRWARPALLAVLAFTALLYTVGLSRSGWTNDFYAAAVQAGTKSWKAFFFGSFDSSNFITVDKTPAFLWVMDISARIFGVIAMATAARMPAAGPNQRRTVA